MKLGKSIKSSKFSKELQAIRAIGREFQEKPYTGTLFPNFAGWFINERPELDKKPESK